MATAVNCIESVKSGDDLTNIVQSTQPIVLKNFALHWPIVQAGLNSAEAACDYLLKFYQGMLVNTCYGAPEIEGRVYYNANMKGFNYQAGQQNLQQVLSKLLEHQNDEKPPTIYVGSTEVTRFLPGFAEQNSAPIDGVQPLTSVWIGNKSKIAAHYDFPLNIAVCAVGKRRFTLFPPEQVENLYVGPMELAPGGQDISLVDITNPDYQQFPKYKIAEQAALVAELEAGDALFLPSMWWHHVEGLAGFNVLVTHWWRNSPAMYGRPTSALHHAILSLRNLPYEQRQAWKALFDYYIFEHDDKDLSHIHADALGMLEKPISEQSVRALRAQLLNQLKR